jgi:predicted dehydrogenase
VFLATFACGAHGFLRASRVKTEQRLLVSGSRGELLWYLDGDRLLERKVGQTLFAEVEGTRPADSPTFVGQFVADIKHNTDSGPSFYDGLKAQQVIDAVLASAVRGHWVSIPYTNRMDSVAMHLD